MVCGVFETVIVCVVQTPTVPAATLCQAVSCPLGPIFVRLPAEQPHAQS